MTTHKKKVVITNRERLWKQVNKKITKVKYTFNPTLYRSSTFDEDDKKIANKPVIIDADDDDVSWVDIISNINWSCIMPNVIDDEDSGEDIEPIEDDEDKSGDVEAINNEDIDFEEYDLEYEKMWD